MFTKPTVFVLGAGASWHYGYPTGEELVRKVKEKADDINLQYISNNSGHTWNWPKNYEYNSKEEFSVFLDNIRLIIKKIEAASPLVIDDFLGMNEDIQSVGKVLIAMVLLECQKREQIRPISETRTFIRKSDVPRIDSDSVVTRTEYIPRGDWIRFITHQLTVNCRDPDDLLKNPVTFVTFNYDMSLENHLWKALKNYTFFAQNGQAEAFMKQPRFHHIYGQIYPFSAEPVNSTTYNNAFELANEIDRAFDAAQNIRTIAPDKMEEHTVVAEAAKQAILVAQNVCFLGYGFDSRNNSLIGIGVHSVTEDDHQYIQYTNFRNHNKINKNVMNVLNIKNIIDNTRLSRSLLEDHFYATNRMTNEKYKYNCNKSIKNVYDALAEDFEFPG